MTAGWFSTVLICRQVHSEAEPVMYQALYLKTSLLPGQVEVFLDSISFVGRVNLTSIHIDLCHWKWWEVIKAHGPFQKSLGNTSSYIKQDLVNLRRLSLTASWLLICWTDEDLSWLLTCLNSPKLCEFDLNFRGEAGREDWTPDERNCMEEIFKNVCSKLIDAPHGCTNLQWKNYLAEIEPIQSSPGINTTDYRREYLFMSNVSRT